MTALEAAESDFLIFDFEADRFALRGDKVHARNYRAYARRRLQDADRLRAQLPSGFVPAGVQVVSVVASAVGRPAAEVADSIL